MQLTLDEICHRSLRQMKQELQAAVNIKAIAGLPCDSETSDTTQYTGAVCAAKAEESEEASSELCKALDDLLIAPKVSTCCVSHPPYSVGIACFRTCQNPG